MENDETLYVAFYHSVWIVGRALIERAKLDPANGSRYKQSASQWLQRYIDKLNAKRD